MVRTIIEFNTAVNNVVASYNTSLHSALDTGVNSRDIFFRNATTCDLVNEFVAFTCLVRFESDLNVTVLTFTTGLTCILAIFVDGFCNCFFVGNLRLTYVSFNFEFTEKSVYDDFKVKLAHAGDDCLTCFFVCICLERYKVRVQEMGKKLGVNIEVISDVREIPLPDPNDRDAVNTYNTNLIAEGWNNLRRVVVNLPNVKSMEELERTVLHETVGHYGLLGIFGFQMSNFLENVLRKASPEVLAGIERMENKYKGRGKYAAVEEYLAHLAEGVSLTPKERGVYARVKEFVRNALVRSRLFTGSNRFLTEADLTEIMQRHCEYMMKRASGRRHRQEVFGDFGISHKAEKHYMDRKTYMKDVRELIDKGVLLPRTHRYLRNTNGFIHAEYMPEEQRVKALMRYYNRP